MASTTFIDNQTVIYAAWLNDVNNAVYNGVFAATSISPANLVCNGSVSGTGFTGLVNNTLSAPGAIGSVTPNTGKFTTLQATSLTGLTTPLSASQGGTGLSSVGTTGYALASNGSAIVYKKLGLGMSGEIWNNVTSSRAINTTYTNSNAFPIMIIVRGEGYNSTWDWTGKIAGAEVIHYGGYSGGGSAVGSSIVFIVPPSTTYAITSSGGMSVISWYELY